jgi:hypothetical protein
VHGFFLNKLTIKPEIYSSFSRSEKKVNYLFRMKRV